MDESEPRVADRSTRTIAPCLVTYASYPMGYKTLTTRAELTQVTRSMRQIAITERRHTLRKVTRVIPGVLPSWASGR